MHIVMLDQCIYGNAPADTYMQELSKALIKAGHQVAFFSTAKPHKGQSELGSFVYVEHKRSFVKHLSYIGCSLLRGVMTGRKFKVFCQEFRADIIHVHKVYNEISPVILKWINIPVVMTAHDYQTVFPYEKIPDLEEDQSQLLEGSLVGNSTALNRLKKYFDSAGNSVITWIHKHTACCRSSICYYIAPSHYLRHILSYSGIPQGRIIVVHNFADPQEVVTVPGKSILYIGRISRERGVDCLIRAFQLLGGNRQLIMCGEGPMRELLQSYCIRENLNVKWLGVESPSKINRYMQKAGLVVIPSRSSENSSMTIVKSLASGRPVIVSDSGGDSELVHHGKNGFIFQSGDTDALKEILSVALKSDLIKLSYKAIEDAAHKFSSEKHLKKIVAIYRHVNRCHFDKSSPQHSTKNKIMRSTASLFSLLFLRA
ncbi:MAG: glycosyltransferase family 4 protein [Lentisphaeraceae bacterium]|nr:glycosyltransferase family 4 protein [Lentisphaeraceae bacterium]